MGAWACPACAGENPTGTRFCGHCGAQAAEADVADALRTFVAGTVADRLVEAGAHLPEERRLVTALFADISGFTPLADRLDPEELLEVIDPLVSALSSVVARYEGYVEKFAGDALLALFGAPVSHDDDAARALRVALEMHAELERMKAELPPDAAGLTLHVGVNSGHGIARVLGSEARVDYAVLGDAVILAQRLESAAPPGETYVSESTVRLAEHRFELEPVGKLTLKGKAEPVGAWRLVGERATHGRARRSRLVGRGRELALLLQAVERGGTVTVTGEPGVGKSRLVEEARAAAEHGELRWLSARGISYGASLPYWPFADLLRRWPDPDALQSPFLAALLGAPMPPGLEPEAFRRGFHDAFAELLAGVHQAVLLLEDAHWLDAASQGLVAELARRGIPHALVLTARPEAEPALEEMVPQRTALALAPLDERAVEELLAAQLGGEPPRGLSGFIARRTEGNPFFVEELVLALTESGALARTEDGRATMRPGWDARSLPPTVEEVLAGRMETLSRAAAATLRTAAVIGRRVPVPLLLAVGGDEAALDELRSARFLDDVESGAGPVLAFHHALVQDVAYERLLRRRRRELHLHVAEQAEALYGAGDDVIDLLARHVYLGGGRNAPDYLLRAGRRARGLYANDEAILHLTRCSELVPENLDLQLELADLHELVGDYEQALRLYQQVRDADGRVPSWRGLVAVHRKRGEFADALAAVDAAFVDDRSAGADLGPLWLEAGWTLWVAGRSDEAADVLRAGLEAAAGREDTTVGQLLLQVALVDLTRGDVDTALRDALHAQRLFEAAEEPRHLARTMRVLGSVLGRAGRLDEAAAALERGLGLAERTGNVEEIGGCLINLGLVSYERGRIADAIAYDRRALEEFERVGLDSGRALAYANLGHKLAESGVVEEALQWAERALQLAQSIGRLVTVADAIDTMASIALHEGRYLEAAESAERAAETYLEAGAAPQAAEALARAVMAWEQAGEAGRAREARARSLTA